MKSFEFTFGFCIPGSENCWETIYDIPSLPEELSKCNLFQNDFIELMILYVVYSKCNDW